MHALTDFIDLQDFHAGTWVKSIVLFLYVHCRLSPAPERSSKYGWTFKLAHIQPEKRTYYFAAYSEREMNVSDILAT